MLYIHVYLFIHNHQSQEMAYDNIIVMELAQPLNPLVEQYERVEMGNRRIQLLAETHIKIHRIKSNEYLQENRIIKSPFPLCASSTCSPSSTTIIPVSPRKHGIVNTASICSKRPSVKSIVQMLLPHDYQCVKENRIIKSPFPLCASSTCSPSSTTIFPVSPRKHGIVNTASICSKKAKREEQSANAIAAGRVSGSDPLKEITQREEQSANAIVAGRVPDSDPLKEITQRCIQMINKCIGSYQM